NEQNASNKYPDILATQDPGSPATTGMVTINVTGKVIGVDDPRTTTTSGLILSYSGNNFTRWKNPRYDALIEKAAAEAAPAKRVQLYDQAQKLLTEEDAAIVPLFIESTNYLVSPWVKGLRIDALGLLKINQVEMTNP
ncbi:MAG: hypothetical protein ACXWR4_04570, partial [Bdellovibrionota bacterium]